MIRIKTIGQGGLGVVSLYQASNGNNYAVKQMIYQWDETHFERFKREIKIMANLAHKNIVKVINHDILNSTPWYLMPYYKDGSLRDRLFDLKSKGQVYSTKAASGIILYLADALGYAHSQGIIHRDLKPENILFNDKEPMLADWGIGKFIHKESKVLTFGGLGTKSYCAPEQWNSGVSDQRSDIYSLGLIYRELLTGWITGQIKDPKVNAIVNKMTMISPGDRYFSMNEVIKDLRALSIVSEKDPMGDFWGGVIAIGATVGLIYVLAKLLER
ncbi:MAG TPA: serine/threonine-protein kinase [Bacteroidales bacterium]|nr:serine/threonine-protein kinase [Bacteroidales bacterium]